MKLTPNGKVIKKCKTFANECVKTNYTHYKNTRNQSNYDKITQDILLGKITEYMVWEFLKETNPDLLPPDIKIYPSKKKSHSADLGEDWHIKSVRKYQIPSWVYQPRCKHLYTGKHIYCIIDQETFEVEIKYIISGDRLKKHEVYSDPYTEWLIGKKVCVYAYDLKPIRKREFVYKCPNEN